MIFLQLLVKRTRIVNMADLLLVKLAVGSVLFVVTLVSGLLPGKVLMYVSARRTEVLVCILNCVAGGIFMGTSLLHMLPEVRLKLIDAASERGVVQEYPLAECIMCIGFFFVFLIEEVALTYRRHRDRRIDKIKIIDPVVAENETTFNDKDTFVKVSSEQVVAEYGSTEDAEQKEDAARENLTRVRLLTLLASLSLHTAFEGLTLGLLDSTSAVLSLFAGVIIHKSVLVFSISMQMATAKCLLRETVAFLTMFGLVSFAGTFIGVVLTETDASLSLTVIASLEGVATGTFVYVTFFEVVQREMSKPVSGVLKVSTVMAGFSVIAGLSAFKWYR